MFKSFQFFIILIILMSCQPSTTRRDLSSQGTVDGSETPDTTGLSIPEQTNWYYNSSFQTTLTLNETNNDLGYLRGLKTHQFLNDNNLGSTYCVGITFTSGPAKELRVKASPITFNQAGVQERLFRINFNDSSSNELNCDQGLEVFNINTSSYVYTPPNMANLSYKNQDVCSNCQSLLSSAVISIYKRRESFTTPNLLVLEPILNSSLDLSTLSYQIDYNNSSGGNPNTGGGTCTNLSCQQQNFDCCLNNQCVNSGQEKPNASSIDPTLYSQSQLELQSNSLAFLNYPTLYYICPTGSNGGTTTGSSGGGNTGNETNTQLINDKKCIDELKLKSEADPFHLEPYNMSESYNECEMTDTTDSKYFKTVMSRMYNFCGCSETSYDNQVSNCPAYYYQTSVFDLNNNPIQLKFPCPVLSSTTTPIPLQNKVLLSAKTAPHRFFNTDGAEINPYKEIPSSVTNLSQEGDPFSYLDAAKTLPLNGSFNMNSILGPMTTTLDKARPAVIVDVVENTTYILSASSGSYSPCPTCAKDSWFSSFSPFPNINTPSGLASQSKSTRRDAYDGNEDFGNYGDTHFGRACFIPPTMIPFSQTEKTTTQAQRLNRLKTQAALFINGYQRDWYGFNRGAAIGSFDGVTWFAIGKGRIVSAKSNKLFLAINAPFADLATNTTQEIDIQLFDGSQSRAVYDYDANLSLDHPNQNSAGTCQANHLCDTDTDCITKLGWEYTCSEIGKTKTKWPNFNVSDASEIPNQSKTTTIANLLVGGFNGSTKRCIYRGAGAPCRRDYQNITDETTRRNFTCAPNFYCADLNSGGVFNKEVSRFAAKLDQLSASNNHFYGFDANLLGRPLDYVSGSNLTGLASDQISTLRGNLLLTDASGSINFGICRPGKGIPTANAGGDPKANPYVQHASTDNLKRTDYISQIGPCDAGNFSNERVSACPVLDSEGNYLYLENTIDTPTYLDLSKAQNSCGLESLRNGTSYFGTPSNTLLTYSPFKQIESKPLPTLAQILEPTHARDACLRRAGSACHTDLDCSPSRLHANEVGLFSDNYYGNTAEKNYWEEYLVCGQADEKPEKSDANYKTYDLTLNRCCRPHGTTLTMYTHKDTNPELDTNTQNIDPLRFGSSNPSQTNRYSRYQNIIDLLNSGDANVPSADTAPGATYSILAQNQWRAIHESGKRTCCGGTWVRKFSDGTTNWSSNRQSFNISNFSCLNYSTPLVDLDYLDDLGAISAADKTYIENQLGLFCIDAGMTTGDFSCAQRPLVGGDLPSRLTGPVTAQVRSVTNSGINNANFNVFGEYVFHKLISADSESQTFVDFSTSAASRKRNSLKLRLPGFILPADIINYSAYVVGATGAASACTEVLGIHNTYSNTNNNNPQQDLNCGGNNCCYELNPADNTIVFGFDNAGGGGGEDIEVAINFSPAGNSNYATPDMNRGMQPANFEYYLKRLERFELTGVPQMTYMPLYCTNDYQRTVPGLFQDQTLNDFQLNGFLDTDADFPFDGTILPAENDQFVTTLDGLDDNFKENPVFSSYEFKCCTGIGTKTSDPANCCSSFGTVKPGDTKYTCQLPPKTDLNLYFNKFISGDGLAGDTPLVDSGSNIEFDERTGYPKDQATVNQKLIVLGQEHCSSGTVRRGGALGFFTGQPNNGFPNTSQGVYSIVDSPLDSATSSSSGATVLVGAKQFNEGYRWNNHYYCD